MKATLIKGTLAALTLTGILAAPALAWDGGVNGCPDGFHAGDTSGVYICHTRSGWHLVTTDPRQTGAHEYTGTISTDGRFADVHLVRPENDDSATLDGNGNLSFDFKTYSGMDGLDWRVDGGKSLTFSLNIDGQPLQTSQISLGDNYRHPSSNPFTLLR